MALPSDPDLPLADLKVLDFSWVGVGPITVKYLADHGATVVRVESHARLDVTRLGPPWHEGTPGIERSQFYASFNTSKLSCALDLTRPEAQGQLVRIEEAVEVFLRTRTKAEVYREGVRRRILVAPVATVADIAADPQLAAREYFRPVDEPAFGRAVSTPGPFARLSATPLTEPRRAPEPGEHNGVVYEGLCGYSQAEVEALRREGVI